MRSFEQVGVDLQFFQVLEDGFVFFLLARENGGLVVVIVEILQLGEAVDALDESGVALAGEGFGQRVLQGLGLGVFDGRVDGVELEPLHGVDGHVDMLGAIEPAAPKPIEVDPGGVLHRAEKIRRRRALEHPALRVGFERVVEQLAAEHLFAEEIQRDGGLRVGVVAEVGDGFGIGHQRHAIGAAHVFGEFAGAAALRVILLPLFLGEHLDERVEALVHPRPLALVGVDDHGKKIMADLVDDDADDAVFLPLSIGAVVLGARAVEADHRILHAAAETGENRPRDRVGIIEGVARIDFERVGDGVGGIFIPERHAFLRVKRHRHDGRWSAAGFGRDREAGDGHRVPDETARGGEGEVAHVVRVENPGFLALRFALRGDLGFVGRDDEDGLLGRRARFGETLALGGGENLVGILQHAGGRNDVIVGHREAHGEAAEIEREFAGAEELLVLPARVIGVGRHAWIPLRDGVVAVAILLEELVAGALA